jgi:hypothetical protein
MDATLLSIKERWALNRKFGRKITRNVEQNMSVWLPVAGIFMCIYPVRFESSASGPFAESLHAFLELRLRRTFAFSSEFPRYSHECVESKADASCKPISLKEARNLFGTQAESAKATLIAINQLP